MPNADNQFLGNDVNTVDCAADDIAAISVDSDNAIRHGQLLLQFYIGALALGILALGCEVNSTTGYEFAIGWQNDIASGGAQIDGVFVVSILLDGANLQIAA